MQDDGEIGKTVLVNVLLHAPQQLTQYLGAHQLGLFINGGVAKPVAIRTIDVASCRHFDKQL